jgi:hypothetical protein
VIVHFTLLGASGACDRAVGAVLVGTSFHGLDALPAFGFALAAETDAFLHTVHAFARVGALLASLGALFAILDTFLHRYIHSHAPYYAVFAAVSFVSCHIV